MEVRQTLSDTRLGKLPEELLFEIFSCLKAENDEDSPFMTVEEAKEHREKLMKDRSAFMESVSEDLYEQFFNLCEH